MLRLDLPRHPFALLDELFGSPRPRRHAPRSSPVEVQSHGDGLTLRTPLPGLDPDAIEISLERDVLRIRAERTPLVPEEAEDNRVIARELPEAPVDLRIRLGMRSDPAGIRAEYELGVLTIEVPSAPEERPHRIPVGHKEEE